MPRLQTASFLRSWLGLLSSCPQLPPPHLCSSLDAFPSLTLLAVGNFWSDTGWLFRSFRPVPARSVCTRTPRQVSVLSPPFDNSLSEKSADAEQVLRRNFVKLLSRRLLASCSNTVRHGHVAKSGDATGRPRAQSSKAPDSFRTTSDLGQGNDNVGDHHGSTEDDMKYEKEEIADGSVDSLSGSSTPESREGSSSSSSESSDESDLSDVEAFRSRDINSRSGTENWQQIVEGMHASSLAVKNAALEENFDGRGEFNIVELAASSSKDKCLREYKVNINEVEEGENGPPYLHTLSLDEAYRILEKARAKDLRHVQMGDKCDWADCMIFASGRSVRHIRGMADALVYNIKKSSRSVDSNSLPTVEGRGGEQWMVVDCGSLVIHLFVEEARNYFNLEEFWRSKSEPSRVRDL